MGFLQIGKKKGKKKSSEQQLMIRSSSKKSSSSASTSSSSPASPVNDFGASDTSFTKRKSSGLFRSSFIPRRSSSSASSTTSAPTTSRFLLKTRASNKSNGHLSVASAPNYRESGTTTNTSGVQEAAAADEEDYDNVASVQDDENVAATPTRRSVSVLSALRVLPASAVRGSPGGDSNSTTTYQLNFEEVEVREEESDAHYSPSPRRRLRYDDDDGDDNDDGDDYNDESGYTKGGINDESFEIIMAESDTPVMDNRALQQQQQQHLANVTATTVTTAESSSSVRSNPAEASHLMDLTDEEEEDDAAYDDEEDYDEPFDARAEARRLQQLSEDPTISEWEAMEKESPPRQDITPSDQLQQEELLQQQQEDLLLQQQQLQEQPEPNLVTPDTVNNTSHEDKALNDTNDNVAAAAAAANNNTKETGYYKSLLSGGSGTSVRRRLIDVFNCVSPDDAMSVVSATGTTIPYHHVSPKRKIPLMDFFYDTVCGVPDVTTMTKKRPFYNEIFALEFLKKMILEGVPLLYLQPTSTSSLTSPEDEKEEDWTGESVTMRITPGVLSASLQLPRLEWSTWGGGWSHPNVRSTSLDLLQIHSVLDHESVMNAAAGNSPTSLLDQTLEGEDAAPDQYGDVHAFTITSEQGDVYIFEASSENERDQVVCGLKNVLARLSYQLIAGDEMMASELFRAPTSDEPQESSSAEPPPLVTPKQAVQHMAQDFLDW